MARSKTSVIADKKFINKNDNSRYELKITILKILLLMLFNAAAVYAIFLALIKPDYIIAAVLAVIVIVFNWLYIRKGANPGKYLAPGFTFLIIFQVFVVIYTALIAFTNYSTGHMVSKDQAISTLVAQNVERVEGSPSYPTQVLSAADGIALVVENEDGELLFGDADTPLEELDVESADQVPGYEVLKFAEILDKQEELKDLKVQITDDPNDGYLSSADGKISYEFSPVLVYDKSNDTITNTKTDTVYTDNGNGNFASESGEVLYPGWPVFVGLDNFVEAFTEDSLSGPLISVTIWTFVFAFLSVASTFFLGLFLAIVFNKATMRGRKIYRTIIILPYAFPAFLSAMIWAGMLNKEYGIINELFFNGASIPWLTDPFLAKLSILGVNLWLGFPYMFLVCMGALQSIPEEVDEAAKIDGANVRQIFVNIKLPLLLVSVAPLLVASFAFNFNNFNLIYMLTNGGPIFEGNPDTIGHTDILISMVYKIAFTGANSDYGLASVFSIFIFLIVTLVTVISFKKTKTLEEVN